MENKSKGQMREEDRQATEEMLKDGKKIIYIAKALDRSPSTISREIKNHIVRLKTGGMGSRFNDCKHRYKCEKRKICPECHANKQYKLCRRCGLCYRYCPDYEVQRCAKLDKPPYVCNGCGEKLYCTLEKAVYSASKAEEKRQEVLKESRSGFSYTEEEIKRIDEIVSPLIKQGQSPHHICEQNKDLMIASRSTIYNLIDAGLISARNIDLPRRVRFKPRKGTVRRFKVDKTCRIGRDFEMFKEFMKEHSDAAVVELDSVEGIKGGKVLLTIHFVKCEMMLAFLRSSNNSQSVIDIFNSIYDGLGFESFRNIFQVCLADNGSEFSNPTAIEFDEQKNRRTWVFYCDPNAPYEKGSCEVNHEFIRRIVPKGVDFGKYTQADISLMMNHINSYGRASLGNKSPYEVFRFFYGDELLNLLGCKLIPPNDIILTKNLFKKGESV